MHDAGILVVLVGLAAAAVYRPWLGVLGLAVLSYLRPQGYAEAFMAGFPAYLLLFLVVVASTAWAAARRPGEVTLPPLDWRLGLLGLLWLWFYVTTTEAVMGVFAWRRFEEVSKTLLPLLLTLLLINTREKLLALLGVIAASFALVAVKGGVWALTTGFGDRVYGPPASHFHDNNSFAVAAAMTVPLLVLWLRRVQDRARALALMGVIAVCVAAALSSWSRGGLLALLSMSLVLVWFARHRLAAGALLAALLLAAFGALPAEWVERMQTLSDPTADLSAQGRLDAWRAGVDYALAHPWLGAGFEGYRFANLAGGQRDWHSVYVELLAEHGFVGLGIWSTLVVGTLAMLLVAGHRRSPPAPRWSVDVSQALAASLVAYCVGGAFLGISYWDILYHLLVLAVVLRSVAARELQPGEGDGAVPRRAFGLSTG